MQQWKPNSGWNTVQSFLRAAGRRMVAHAKLNADLSQEQRDLLQAEGSRLRAKADEVKTLGRALEDFVDGELGDVRQEAFVWDMGCDDVNQDAWRILQTSAGQKALAVAGKTREAIFDTTRINEVLRVGRMRTVTITRTVGERVGKLTELPDGGALSAKLLAAADGLRGVAVRLEAPEGDLMVKLSQHYEAIESVVGPVRNDLTPMYGRLLSKFPKPFVEKLFPRVSRSGEVDDSEEPVPGSLTAAG
ncbi:MAG: hypothetical protein MUF54_22185 [Polyangiaceae bacterium]|nr:hypothetical protein [Polyangiaceae bacterium]